MTANNSVGTYIVKTVAIGTLYKGSMKWAYSKFCIFLGFKGSNSAYSDYILELLFFFNFRYFLFFKSFFLAPVDSEYEY